MQSAVQQELCPISPLHPPLHPLPAHTTPSPTPWQARGGLTPASISSDSGIWKIRALFCPNSLYIYYFSVKDRRNSITSIFKKCLHNSRIKTWTEFVVLCWLEFGPRTGESPSPGWQVPLRPNAVFPYLKHFRTFPSASRSGPAALAVMLGPRRR